MQKNFGKHVPNFQIPFNMPSFKGSPPSNAFAEVIAREQNE
jgi:hypothetical protein